MMPKTQRVTAAGQTSSKHTLSFNYSPARAFRPYAGSSTFDTVIYSNWTYLDELPSGPTIRGMNSPIRSYEKVGSPSVSWLKALRKESLELRALPAFVQ